MSNVSERSLEAQEERAIARRILALEAEIRRLLSDVPECKEALASQGRFGRTRAHEVNRLKEAVRVAPTPGCEKIRKARAHWEEAGRLRWKLAMSATRVVYREANRLSSNPVVPHADLVQEGLIGLLDAAKRFEPSRDIRFATYARWWARAHMTRAIDMGRVVHLSAAACEQLRNLRKQIRLHELAGESWSPQDLANELGMEVDRVRMLLGIGTGQPIDDEGDNEDGSSAPQLADETHVPADETLATTQAIQLLRSTLETALPDRQRHILLNRYGIDREASTLTDIAKTMKLSRERVRQLERHSLDLLRDAWARSAS